MRLYATTADVWEAGTEPANAAELIRAASKLVDYLLVGIVYDVDAEGMPTDADVITSLRDACKAIALECAATGALSAGNTQQWESVTIGSVSLSTLQGASASDTPTVGGVPIPAAALLALSGVGETWVYAR